MKELELLEHLANNARIQADVVEGLLGKQDEIVKKAYQTSDSQLMNHFLSGGLCMADKTTVFQM